MEGTDYFRGVKKTEEVSFELRIEFYPWSCAICQLCESQACSLTSLSITVGSFLKVIYLFKLEANYFTMLWWFLPYINMNQP